MNILILSPFLPYPPDSGAKMRTLSIIQSLEGHKCILIAFSDKKETRAIDELKKYCSDIFIFEPPRISNLNVILNHFSLKPLLSQRFYSREAYKKINEIVENVDVIIFESLLMAEYGKNIKSKVRILDELNIEFIRAKRRLETISNFLKKIYYWLIYYRLKRYELKIINSFEGCIVCSEIDKEVLKRHISDKRIDVIPNVVDTDFFTSKQIESFRNRLIFVGTMWYEPNLDAVRFFIQDIFPLIRDKIKDVELLVVGEYVEKDISFLKEKEGVRFVGYVDDIRVFLKNASVFVAPLRMGSGTRLKILTAMAMGIPVVSTRIGCEGLEVEDGKDIFIADTPEEFADKVIKLIKDEELRKKISENGRNLVEDKYSRKKVIEIIKAYLNSLSFLKKND